MTMTRPVAGEIIAVTTTTFTAQSGALNEAPAFGSLLRVANPRRKAGGPGIAAYYALCYGSQTGSIEPGRHAVAWGRFEDDEEDIYQRQPQLAQVLRTTFDALLVGYETAVSTPRLAQDQGSFFDVATPGTAGILPASACRQDAGGPRGAVPLQRNPSGITLGPSGDGADHYSANGYAAGDAAITVLNGAVMAAVGDTVAPAPVQRVPAAPPRLHALVCQATPVETARFNQNLTYLRFVLRANLPLADDFIAAAIRHAYEASGCDESFLLDAARTVARLLGAEHERVMNILELLDDQG